MKFTYKQRLEFENIYPNENAKEIIEYLKLVTKEALLNIIGFTNTYPQPNYDNFTSNENLKKTLKKELVIIVLKIILKKNLK